MNFKWLLFNLQLQNVRYFAENAEGKQPLSVEGEELDLELTLSDAHAKMSAIQQVIRNAKKT